MPSASSVGRQADSAARAAPFDAIIVTAAPGFAPTALVKQLAADSRMIVPIEEIAGRRA